MDPSFLKRTFTLFTLLSINFLWLNQLQAKDFDSKSSSYFYSYEAHGSSYINGVGMVVYENYDHNKFGSQFITSLNTASVLTKQGIEESYFAWEASATYGYFSDIFIYAELGLDITELLLEDFLEKNRNNNNCNQYDNCNDEDTIDLKAYKDIDAFAGFAAGVHLDNFKIEGFARLRKIDSKYDRWDAGTNWFAGVKFSIDF